jgi:hypothetical protein
MVGDSIRWSKRIMRRDQNLYAKKNFFPMLAQRQAVIGPLQLGPGVHES